MNLTIFTDGASKGNPGRGGWGAIVAADGKVVELGGREDNVTNNQMELRAAIEALRFVAVGGAAGVDIYADSSYVIDGITKWIFSWQKNNWRTAAKKPVLNAELWKQLADLNYGRGFKASWHYVGGHVGIPGNERVDEIACGFADNKKVKLYNGPAAGYSVDLKNLGRDDKLHAAKSASRSRSKQPAHSYVSEVDGVVKIHKTWAECEARVKGKKARFKKVFSVEEEKKVANELGR